METADATVPPVFRYHKYNAAKHKLQVHHLLPSSSALIHLHTYSEQSTQQLTQNFLTKPLNIDTGYAILFVCEYTRTVYLDSQLLYHNACNIFTVYLMRK
jgi:hypothetical protein